MYYHFLSKTLMFVMICFFPKRTYLTSTSFHLPGLLDYSSPDRRRQNVLCFWRNSSPYQKCPCFVLIVYKPRIPRNSDFDDRWRREMRLIGRAFKLYTIWLVLIHRPSSKFNSLSWNSRNSINVDNSIFNYNNYYCILLFHHHGRHR